MKGDYYWWERVRCDAVWKHRDLDHIQCTREKDHEGPHYSAYNDKAWA